MVEAIASRLEAICSITDAQTNESVGLLMESHSWASQVS